MQIIADEIDGSIYIDIILDCEDMDLLEQNEMISGDTTIVRRKFYLGVRLKDDWDEEEIGWTEED